MRQAIDRAVIAVQRRIRRRRREREVADMALPGLEAYTPPVPSAQPHTAAHVAAGGKLARRRSLKVALAAVVVSASVGVPAYLTGSTVAGAAASEEAEQAAYDEAAADYDAAQSREAAALHAAVAAYSAEREAEGETLPEEAAVERLQAEHGLSEMEAADVAEGNSAAAGIGYILGQTPITAEAERMWSAEPPDSDTAQESIQAYEAAAEEAEAEKQDYEVALDRAIDE